MADKKWFSDLLPEDGSAQIFDLTSSYTTVGIWGPKAREIIKQLLRPTWVKMDLNSVPAKLLKLAHYAYSITYLIRW